MSASMAPIPDDIVGLRRQNSAYRALCASLEEQIGILTKKERAYQEAVSTLDSERAANAILTAELEATRIQIAAYIDAEAEKRRGGLRLGLRVIAQNVRAGLDEREANNG